MMMISAWTKSISSTMLIVSLVVMRSSAKAIGLTLYTHEREALSCFSRFIFLRSAKAERLS